MNFIPNDFTDYQSSPFNLENFYALPGDDFNFDINHANYEDFASYHTVSGTWGDLSWLNLSEDGVLSGTVPEDFQYGGRDIYADITVIYSLIKSS